MGQQPNFIFKKREDRKIKKFYDGRTYEENDMVVVRFLMAISGPDGLWKKAIRLTYNLMSG